MKGTSWSYAGVYLLLAIGLLIGNRMVEGKLFDVDHTGLLVKLDDYDSQCDTKCADNDGGTCAGFKCTGRQYVKRAIYGLWTILNIEIADPRFGIAATVIEALLPLVFPDGDDPKQDVWVERVKQQHFLLARYKDSMEHIIRIGKTSEEAANNEMTNLCYQLNDFRCHFMRDDNIQASVAYFRKFATIHIAVNQALIIINGQSSSMQFWVDNLDKNVRQYIAYGYYITQRDANQAVTADPPFSRKVRNDLLPNIDKWISQLNSSSEAQLRDQRIVFYDRPVAFKIVPDPELRAQNMHWISCTTSECSLNTCPGSDNPMERRTSGDFKCAGEIFKLKKYYEEEVKIVRNCDLIRIYHEQPSGWLSWKSAIIKWLFSPSLFIVEDQCSNDGWRNKLCGIIPPVCSLFNDKGETVWQIKLSGKKTCGEPIQDRDTIQLCNKDDSSCAFQSVHYTIFKSDVPRYDSVC